LKSGFWSTLTRFDRAQLKPAMAARNALGVAIPLAIGIAIGNSSGGAMGATGAQPLRNGMEVKVVER